MLWHQQYDDTWNFKSFATVITNQSVILTILFLQCIDQNLKKSIITCKHYLARQESNIDLYILRRN